MAIAYYSGRIAVGTAAERGAATWTGAPNGYRFLETDTLKTYIWSGSAWFEQVVAASGGTLGVAAGGTGATTLTGILKGNGTSAVTASNTFTGVSIDGSTNTLTNLAETSLSRTTRTSAYLTMPSFKRRGMWIGMNPNAAGDGLWSQAFAQIAVGTGVNTKTIDATDGAYSVSSSGATTGGIGGERCTTYTCRGLNPYLKMYARLNNVVGTRITFGFIAASASPAAAADPLAVKTGAVFFFDDAVNANFRFFTNNGGASSHNTDTTVPATTGLWMFEIQADETNSQFKWTVSAAGGGAYANETNTPPATATNMGAFMYIESTSTGAKTMNLLYAETEQDK